YPTTVRSGAPQAGDPLAGLSKAQLALFADGRDAFEEEETVEDGLGPVFNDVSCATCHSAPVTGGGSTRLVTRFGAVANGVFDPLASWGGSLIQDHGIGPQGACEFVSESVPPPA